MSRPPGDRPDDERPEFHPPYTEPPSGWPPTNGPSGGPPYGPAPGSRMKPPWRNAPPGESGTYLAYAALGFAGAWFPIAVGVVLAVADTDLIGYGLVLLLVAGVIDLVGIVLAFAPDNRTVRSIGWGAFVAFLTHVVAGAIGIVVLFGWCISVLNDYG